MRITVTHRLDDNYIEKAWKHAEMEEIEDVAAGLLGKAQEAQSIEDDLFSDIVRRALGGEAVTVEGEIFRLSGAQLSRRPVRSEVPVYIAGIGPRVLELAGKIADGAFLIFPTENSLRTSLRHIGAGANRANRDPGEIGLSIETVAGLSIIQ